VLLASLAATTMADGNVVVLTPDNFDEVVGGSAGVLVEFYAPWCGHCKHLAPIYELVADALAHVKDKVVIAKVDADAHRELGSRFDVTGFPTLKWFAAGSTEAEAYSGDRSEDDLVAFVERQAGVKAKKAPQPLDHTVILTDKNFDSLITSVASSHALVEFYAPWCGHCKRLAPDYAKLANVYKNEPSVVIAKVDCDAHKAVCSKYGVSGFPTLKWFPQEDKANPVDYSGGRDVESFVEYINENAHTLRDPSGRLSAEAGRLAELAPLAAGYAEAADKDERLAKATSVAAALTGEAAKSGKIYLKAMEALKTKPTYVASELERLQKIIESGSLSDAKVDEFTVRRNILASF